MPTLLRGTAHYNRILKYPLLPLRQLVSRRYFTNEPRPHAYLRPLAMTKDVPDEFEGVMCLVLDRKEAKNALSVQMVGVSSLSHLVGPRKLRVRKCARV